MGFLSEGGAEHVSERGDGGGVAGEVEGAGEFDEVAVGDGDSDGPGFEGLDGVAVVELVAADFEVDVVESEVAGGGLDEGPAGLG